MKRIIEICANSAQSCVEAEAGGATRVELCAGIPEGGTTPSYGEIKTAKALTSKIDINVIIRPRGGSRGTIHAIGYRTVQGAKSAWRRFRLSYERRGYRCTLDAALDRGGKTSVRNLSSCFRCLPGPIHCVGAANRVGMRPYLDLRPAIGCRERNPLDRRAGETCGRTDHHHAGMWRT